MHIGHTECVHIGGSLRHHARRRVHAGVGEAGSDGDRAIPQVEDDQWNRGIDESTKGSEQEHIVESSLFSGDVDRPCELDECAIISFIEKQGGIV